jgi:hypothetical protein
MNIITKSISGGCQCGAVRYRVSAVLDSSHICHCRMCQKAVGNFFAALVGIPREAFEWTRGAPALFKSSDLVDRGFCKKCGTPLLYDFKTSQHLNVTTGSLDDPTDLPPKMQFGIEGRMPWFPEITTIQEEGTTEQTMASVTPAIKASNHQHPDFDTDDRAGH